MRAGRSRIPDLEFTLTDTNGATVVRRVLTPPDYAGGVADLAKGIPGGGEVPIKLFIDASATTQAGYTPLHVLPVSPARWHQAVCIPFGGAAIKISWLDLRTASSASGCDCPRVGLWCVASTHLSSVRA